MSRMTLAYQGAQALILAGVFGLVGCSSTSYNKQQNVKIMEVPSLESTTSTEHSVMARLKPHGFSLGSWLDPFEKGHGFQPLLRSNPNSAVVYLYRPDSTWSRHEVAAASIFLNGKRLKSLKNNHYYAIEMPAGTYELSVRRPLLNIYFQKGSNATFTVKAGQDYYVKYAEQHHVSPPNGSEGLLMARPLMQVPNSYGLKEIALTRAKTPSYRLAANPNQDAYVPEATVAGQASKEVSSEQITETTRPDPKPQFKIYNPISW